VAASVGRIARPGCERRQNRAAWLRASAESRADGSEEELATWLRASAESRGLAASVGIARRRVGGGAGNVAASVGRIARRRLRRSEQRRSFLCERRRSRRIPRAIRASSKPKQMSVGPSKYELQGPTG
jgi:hypothetical protein